MLIALRSAALLVVLFVCGPASAWVHGSAQSPLAALANSQLNPNYIYSGEGLFINALKWGGDWTYSDNSIHALPTDLTSNGYPINGSGGFSVGGYKLVIAGMSSQFERPGNFVLLASGRGTMQAFNESATTTGAACVGTQSGSGNIICNNASCGTITGTISGQVFTVTVAPSCALKLYQPVTNGTTITNQFGVPTIIIGNSTSGAQCGGSACTGTTGTGTYLVNWSQTNNGPFIPGYYNEFASASESTRSNVTWDLAMSASDATNPLDTMAFVHKNDLLAYAKGQLTGALFKQRVAQGNFAYLRDLNTATTNISSVSTWATRKPAGYYSYNAPEMRASLYAGVATYALNGSSNDYSVNLGASLPVDKQTVCARINTSNTNSTVTFSIDGGTTKYTVLDYHGGAAGTLQTFITSGFVFNKTINSWFAVNGGGCINNAVPPEAFVQLNQEMGTAPWVVEPMYASDPITDYPTQYAILVSGFTWTNPPVFEVLDEIWNCSGQGVSLYASVISHTYIAIDTTWATNASGHDFCGYTGDIQNWTGKVGSLLGQAIRQVSSSYPVIVGVQTVGNASSKWNATVLSNSYVGQNPANIPIQSGCAGPGAIQTSCPAPFRQTAAYSEMKGSLPYSSAITIANYWSLNYQATTSGLQTEVALAWCYFYQAGGCTSQSATMTSYFSSQQINGANNVPGGGGNNLQTIYANWNSFAKNCAGGATCTPMAVYNYEGTYTVGTTGLSDQTATVTAATNVAQAVLTVNPNGCVAGQTVAITSASGGTWPTAVGSYTVQSATSTTCTINLNSSGLGTLSSATLTYTGSSNYVAYLRQNSWTAPDLATWSTTLFNAIASVSGPCAPAACSKFPSQFNFASTQSANNWFAWSPDLYGYFQVASCSACTATGGNLTLGGTVAGIFTSGLTIVGGGISGATVTGVCSQTGTLPAGANSGDICPISSGATMTSKALNGSIAPPTNAAGNSTTSPIKQWGAICKWNGNTQQCDGI